MACRRRPTRMAAMAFAARPADGADAVEHTRFEPLWFADSVASSKRVTPMSQHLFDLFPKQQKTNRVANKPYPTIGGCYGET